MPERILIVDDEESIRFTLETFLSEEGYAVSTAASYDEAVSLLNTASFDLFFVDILLGRFSGIDFLRTVRNGGNNSPVVMITGSPDVETASEAVRLGAFDYIPKPIRQETLLRVARAALRHHELLDQKEAYRRNLEAIFRSVKDGILLVDDNLKILEVNASAQEICGFDDNDIGTEFASFSSGCTGDCLSLLRKVLEMGKSGELSRVKCRGRSGKERVLNLTASPLVSDNTPCKGAVLVIRDESRIDDLERDLDRRKSFHKMVGQTGCLQNVYRLIDRLCDVDTTVLITGESGTGKELVAEAIHYMGVRKDKPMVKVNCAALPENLLESELFGHIKGAFTGAIQNKVGRFQLADGGTIFLDEIGDISPALQVRLLRVLQEKQIERVGSATPIPVDVRIIAATNRNLQDKIRSGEFREDLFYRLKVVTVSLPPLRERKEDIPLLVEAFIRKFNDKFGKNVRGLSDDVLRCFMDHSWPGNVRELEHVLEHAFVLCRRTSIEMDDLPPEMQSPQRQMDTGEIDEREKIRQALVRTDGNKAKAARLLNMSRRTIYRKIEDYELD